jgi:hypothetical protein
MPTRSKWNVVFWVAIGVWLAACGAAFVLAHPVVNWLLGLPVSLIEGQRDPAFYVGRLREILPFLAAVGGVYAVVLHAVLLPGGEVATFLGTRRRRVLGLIALAVGLLLALTPRYLTGDEPHYLVMMESLWRDRDLNLVNQARQTSFDVLSHAVPTADTDRAYSIHFPGVAFLLFLPYGLFGVRGVLIGAALLWAAVVLVTQTWSRRTPAGTLREPDPILLTVVFSLPMSVLAGEVFPEIPAALLIAVAVAALEARAEGAWWLAGIATAALPWFQVRLIGLAFVLAVMAGRVLSRRAWLPLVALVGSLTVQGVFFDKWYGSWVPWAMYPPSMGIPRGNPALGVLGMFFDQQAGLLPTAPIYLLVVPALLSAWRSDRTRTLWRLAVVVSYLTPVMGSTLWHGNWSPPARLWGPVLPVLMVWIFDYVRGSAGSRGRSGLWRVLAVLSILWGLLYASFPDKRCSLMGFQGTNYFLSLFARVTHLPVGLVFPHLQQPGPADPAVAMVELALWVAGGWMVFRRNLRRPQAVRQDGH